MPNDMTNEVTEVSEFEGNITKQDVVTVAERAFGDSAIKVVNYSIDEYSKNKLGFLGCHHSLKITIKAEDKDDQEEASFFIKSILKDCGQAANFIRRDGLFDEEAFFYERIVPELTKNYKGERWSSKCFLVKEDVMVLEDLRSQGYRVIGNIFDEPIFLKAALTTLAQFHACSILAESRLNQTSQHRLTLKDVYPDSLVERIFVQSSKSSRQRCEVGIKAIVAIAERLGYDEAQKLHRTIEKIYDIVKPSTKYHNVISHSDLWTNNLMFDDSQPLPRCILVDFQFVRYAPLVLDILMLLYFNTSREFRRSKEKDLITFYYSVLKKTVTEGGIVPRDAKFPTFEDMMTEYEDLRLYGSALASLTFPVMLLSTKGDDKYFENPESCHEFFNEDRINVTLELMEKDLFYKKKIEEAVAEVAEIAMRL